MKKVLRTLGMGASLPVAALAASLGASEPAQGFDLLKAFSQGAGQTETVAPTLDQKLKSGKKFDSHLPPNARDAAHIKGDILIRYFKVEKELEVWEADGSGTYTLRHTFDVCKFGSPDSLDTKTKYGDLKSPFGIYHAFPVHLNETGSFKYPIMVPYPNAVEKYQNFTGDMILIHNDIGLRDIPTSSAGCVAVCDAHITKLRAIVEKAFKVLGQKSIQIQGFPFRMTDANMKKYGGMPKYKKYLAGLWGSLKTVFDKFERTRKQPNVVAVAQGNNNAVYKLLEDVGPNEIYASLSAGPTALRTAVANAKNPKTVIAAAPERVDIPTPEEVISDLPDVQNDVVPRMHRFSHEPLQVSSTFDGKPMMQLKSFEGSMSHLPVQLQASLCPMGPIIDPDRADAECKKGLKGKFYNIATHTVQEFKPGGKGDRVTGVPMDSDAAMVHAVGWNHFAIAPVTPRSVMTELKNAPQ